MRFTNKVAVVTGGGAGIGAAAARLFAAEGGIVAVNDSREDAAQAVVEEIAAAGGTAIAIPGDVADEAAVKDNVATVMARFGRIDVLHSNAGIPIGMAAEDYSAWRRSLSINLDGMFYWCQAVAKASMLPNRSGSIVTMSSLAGLGATIGDIGYVTAKHGIVGLTKGLAAEWARKGVRVNCVAPGITNTLMVNQTRMANPEGMAKRIDRVPLGRAGEPEELARAVLFLASDDASYITGVTIAVDGGQMAVHSGMVSLTPLY